MNTPIRVWPHPIRSHTRNTKSHTHFTNFLQKYAISHQYVFHSFSLITGYDFKPKTPSFYTLTYGIHPISSIYYPMSVLHIKTSLSIQLLETHNSDSVFHGEHSNTTTDTIPTTQPSINIQFYIEF